VLYHNQATQTKGELMIIVENEKRLATIASNHARGTLEARMNNAFKSIRQQGIVAKRNVAGCCRSCIDLGLADNVPVIWSYGGQGGAVYVEHDYATSDTIYLNHDNLFTSEPNSEAELNDAGKRVIETFAINGIDATVEAPYRCILIHITTSGGTF
jgi:hypothetical protein